jgi:protein-disulfide isomerase
MSFRLAAAFVIGMAAPASALDLTTMTDGERDAFGAEVRAYLLENPQVLMEAIAVLEQREAEARVSGDIALVRENAKDLFNDGHSWVGGNPDGDLTLVEFMDYRCGYCKQAFTDVEKLIGSDGNIRLILKEFPILGEQSTLSAQFAIAVQQLHGDDAYKQVHDALMEMRTEVTADALARLAEGFDLDAAPIIARMAGPEVAAVIDANRELAARLQISGTPTFVIDEQMLRGYVPLAQMQQIAAAIRAE